MSYCCIIAGLLEECECSGESHVESVQKFCASVFVLFCFIFQLLFLEPNPNFTLKRVVFITFSGGIFHNYALEQAAH